MTDKQCDRCGEVNPAEIHTCSPNYVDRRQWKYDPMTGEPLVDGWPLYSGLPEPEPVAWMYQHEDTGLTMCVIVQQVGAGFEKNNPRWKKITPLYTAQPQREWQGLTDEEIENCFEMSMFGTCRAIEAKLKEKNAPDL